jgi:hypothetical protein
MPRLAASSRGRTRSTASELPPTAIHSGPSEYRRGDKVLPVLLMRFPQQTGKLDADGGERDMNRVYIHRGENARSGFAAEDDGFRRRIVAEHGEDDRDPGDRFGE